jgi:hypothetical protein
VEEGDRRRCGRDVTDGEGVDIDGLRAHAVLFEVVAGPELQGRWRSMMSSRRKTAAGKADDSDSTDEEGSRVACLSVNRGGG